MTDSPYFEVSKEQKPYLLFAFHDLRDTIEMQLWLKVLQHIQSSSPVNLVVLTELPGPLYENFAKIARVCILFIRDFEADDDGPENTRHKEVLSQVFTSISENPPQLSFVNALKSPVLFDALSERGLEMVTLVDAVFLANDATRIERVLTKSKTSIFASQHYQNYVADHIDLGSYDTHSFGLCLANETDPDHEDRLAGRIAVRTDLGIPLDAKVVLCCAERRFLSGIDLFGTVAKKFFEQQSAKCEVYFLWIGAGSDKLNLPNFYARHQMLIAGKANRLLFSGLHSESAAMDAADVYLSVSRQGQDVGVLQEAKAAGVPLVLLSTQENAPDFSSSEGSLLVDCFDIGAAAKMLDELLSNEPHHITLSKAARSSVYRESRSASLVALITEIIHQQNLQSGSASLPVEARVD